MDPSAILASCSSSPPVELRSWGANRSRRPEYQIEKWVEQRGKEKVFVRAAAGAAAQPFLATIHKREQIAAQYFDNKAEVVGGTWEGERLVYPYIEKATLEEQIAAAIEQEKEAFALELVEEYSAFLKCLPGRKCVPTAYYDFIKFQPFDLQPLECVSFAPYDCIPRNIVAENGKWRLLDLEWTFEFPLPREFLFWRGLMSIVGALQGPIQRQTSKRNPVVLFRGYGRTRVYLPQAWYIRFDLGNADLEKYQRWEELFERKISLLGLKKTPLPRLSKPPRVFTSIPKSGSGVIIVEELMKEAVTWMRKYGIN